MKSKLATVNDYGIAKRTMRQDIESESVNRAPIDRLTYFGGLRTFPPKILEPRSRAGAQRPVKSVDSLYEERACQCCEPPRLVSAARIALANDARRPY
jgi:hypothetical protein